MISRSSATVLGHRIKATAYSLLVLFVAGTLGTGVASAQNASLGGTVMDESGAVIPGATITVAGIDTGVETKANSNATGTYQFPSLAPGSYRVVASTAGFAESVRSPVALSVGGQVRLNFTMHVAAAAETVEVVAAAESLMLASGAVVGSLLGTQQIADLPLVDRNAANLTLTQPGVEGGIGGGVSVAGADTQALLVTVDGINVSNTRITRAGGLNSFQLSQSVDLVSEVRVTSSPADAEFGRSVGRVEMVTRSGTNEFHGSLANGFRNPVLNANTYWNNLYGRPRQVLKRNQFAGRIGGPIIKNKTFFFFLYDGNRERGEDTSINTVLTASARQGIYRYFPGKQNQNAAGSNPSIDPNGNPVAGPLQSINIFGIDPNRQKPDPTGIVKGFIDKTPLPNYWETGDGLNTAGYAWAVSSYHNKDHFTGKIDHMFNSFHTLTTTFTYEHQKYTNMTPRYPTAPEINGYNNVPSKFLSVNLTSTLTPTLVNMFKFGFQYPNMDQRAGQRVYPDSYPQNNGQLYEPYFTSFTSPLTSGPDSQLVNPVYTIANNISWIRGKHAFRGGFQFDHMESNSFNILNSYTPRVYLGEGAVPLQGTGSIPGLISSNQGTLEDMIIDLTGSVDRMQQGFKVKSGSDLTWIPLQNQRYWNQRSLGFFFKDDWKVSRDLTLNLGLRWDWTGPPSEQFGRTTGPASGFGGYFGVSGTGIDALWKPGASGGELTRLITIGGNSANPDHMIHKNYWTGFGPAVGISWNIPYWGQDKTVLRMGYQISRPMAQSFLSINSSVGDIATTATFEPADATFLNSINLPLVPDTEPLELHPINQKTERLDGYAPNFQPPVVQNYNASIERELTPSTTIAVRYVGNRSTHQNSNVDYNHVNVFENGIWEAANITAMGGDAPLFDTLLMGINVPGVGVVDGVKITGSDAFRGYSGTRNYFGRNEAASFANWLNTTLSLQPSDTAERGGIITQAGLPVNFVVVNPQYTGVRIVTSDFNRRYDSAIFELNRRTTRGWGYQINFTWAKRYTLNGVDRNFRNWNADRSVGGQLRSLKVSGTYEFPVGPGKRFLNSTTGAAGVLGKILGGWQVGGFLTMNSGDRLSFSCSGNPTGDDVWCNANGALPVDPGKLDKRGDGGVYWLGSEFERVTDPFCGTLTTEQKLNTRCNLYAMTYNGQMLFQNPAQGETGTFNPVTGWLGPGLFNLDMNLLKRFDITERVSGELRLDAIALPNHPHFTNPTTSISSSSFGRISEPRVGGNAYTQPAPYYGNRVFVINARVSF